MKFKNQILSELKAVPVLSKSPSVASVGSHQRASLTMTTNPTPECFLDTSLSNNPTSSSTRTVAEKFSFTEYYMRVVSQMHCNVLKC